MIFILWLLYGEEDTSLKKAIEFTMAGQMDQLALLFKPDNFSVTDRTDPELYLQEWQEYVDRFKKFLKAVPGAVPQHAADHTDCEGCTHAKVMM